MEGDAPDLSVVVVLHNAGEQAVRTLASARAHLGEATADWLVVDSGSTDDAAARIEERWPDVRVLRGPNVGFAAANNRALRDARGRYILLLNPDVEIARGTLAGLVQALDDRPEVGAASVVQVDGDGELLHSIRRFPSPARQLGEALLAARWPVATRWEERDRRAGRYASECSADWLVGAFLVARREAVAAVGGLDERFFLYSEEADWCLRIRRAGWDVRHLPVMTIRHLQGGYGRPELLAQRTYSKLLFARKHHGAVRAGAMRLALALGHALRARGPRAASERLALAVALRGTYRERGERRTSLSANSGSSPSVRRSRSRYSA